VAQFVFGYGTGGEYPMASGSAAERAEAGGKEAARKRGRTMVLTFSMQASTPEMRIILMAAKIGMRCPILHVK
jgi:hypothetical protein